MFDPRKMSDSVKEKIKERLDEFYELMKLSFLVFVLLQKARDQKMRQCLKGEF